MSSDDIVIRVQNISKCYHIYNRPEDRLKQSLYPKLQWIAGRKSRSYYHEFWALRDVSFEVKKGETVGIIGRNGSGKSTLLQILCGTLTPTSGSVETSGRIAALLELGSGFNPEFTGRENVYMNGAVLGLSREEIDARFDEIAAFADIGEFIEQAVKTYSSGMMVRLAFAVSVCVEPDILIVDEALAVGDAAFQFKCLDRLQKLTSNGTTLLFVSHDMGMVKNFCNHVIYLHHGMEKAKGAPDEMAELYFLDMRDEQRRGVEDGKRVSSKPFLGENKGIAFGTEEGHILSACFTNNDGHFSSYIQGEEIEVRVRVKFRESLTHPCLSLIVQDRRMMDFGGGFFPLKGGNPEEGWKQEELTMRWPAKLAGGRYSITVRMENRESEWMFMLIDKQVGLLTFEVLEEKKTFLGAVDLGIRAVKEIRIVALLTVRNEALYLARCIEHLHHQGIETCVIDNESTDNTLEIAKSFLGRGVFRIETQPYEGFFDLTAQLQLKERLAAEIDADWFIHHDADEIREAPAPYKTLKEGIEAADRAGYNAINFDEFVFLPTSDTESHEGGDYVATMRRYYFFEPSPLRRVNAWKKTEMSVHVVDSGGHCIDFEGRRIFPVNFVMRHYIALSSEHAIAKYTRERVYSRQEVEHGWHGARATFEPSRLHLPGKTELKFRGDGPWDKSQPWVEHKFLGDK